MKIVNYSEKYGKIIYSESFWTGKKSIFVDDVQLKKTDNKKQYVLFKDGESIWVTLKGNYLSGSTLQIENEVYELSPKLKWYEWVLALIPFILTITWGNSVKLVQIFPIIGGAIGGAISGIGLFLSLLAMKQVQKPGYKVLIGVGACIVTIFTLFLGAMAYVLFTA